jgi:hypothetical protein
MSTLSCFYQLQRTAMKLGSSSLAAVGAANGCCALHLAHKAVILSAAKNLSRQLHAYDGSF